MNRVETSSLLDLAETLAASATAIEATLDRLDHDIRRLKGSWSGSAAGAYEQAHTEWTSTMGEIRQMLSQASRRARWSAREYAEVDHSVARMWPDQDAG